MKVNVNVPFTLPCGITINNRLAKSALTERLAKADRLPNELHHKLYEHWAKNGAGLLFSGNIIVDKRYLESTGNIVIERDTPVEPFKKWTSKVSSYGNQFWAQLSHAGRQSSVFSCRKPVSASDIQLKKLGLFGKPTALNEEGIENVISRFVYASKFCKDAGFSGVQFHAAHGYLISQFLSPRTNKRDDKWGGNIENRGRLLFEIIDRSRAVLGKEFPISVKLNSADFQRGGFDQKDSLFIIKALAAKGVDLLEISGGTYEKSAMFGVGMKESTRSREAYFLDFATEVRKECDIPLMVTGGFRTLEICNEALENNELDLVGFGRPFLIDEKFPEGFINGKTEKIENPDIKILDPNSADAAEAGYYDLQIKNLANGRAIKPDYSSIKLAFHIPSIEMKMGLRNWWFG